ncbi:MAG TPA: mechanosensitive ion channel domain-containing protein [Verrucomicrobiae bacterium]|jgi:small-conductance mechanosensitive channel|nr:mechanosensitive ion channel domain-containing protein [Verrucomicrobiae bacterium]
MNAGEILNQMASGLSSLIAGALHNFFGANFNRPALGPITLSDLCVTSCLVILFFALHAIAAFSFKAKTGKAITDAKFLKGKFFGALGKPLYLLIWIFGVYISITPLLLRIPKQQLDFIRTVADAMFGMGLFAVLIWFFLRLSRVIEAHLAAWATKTESKLDDLLVPLAGKSLRILTPVLGIIFAIPVLNLPPNYAEVITKGSSILLITAVALILCQLVNLGEKYLLTKYDIGVADNLQARKLYTQVHVLSKTLYFIISLFAVASMLMLFEEVRRLGASILASAGVIGVVLGFAAQKTIANLFAGFQLAMTQPIRLDDVVIVENEWGRIEEISLTYVVIHIWDDRRLVVPLSYFIEKPFQNWTRATSQLLGSVFVFADYSLPLDQAREALKEIIENHPLWDKRFWNLQVTDATDKTMQLRVLATSADSSRSWDLRCDIREKFIAYIQKTHPQSLPRVRAEFNSAESGNELKPAVHKLAGNESLVNG